MTKIELIECLAAPLEPTVRGLQRALLVVLMAAAWMGLLGMPVAATATWVSQPNPLRTEDIHSSEVNAVDFVDQNVGWAVGYGPGIVHTIDGGASWTLQTVPLTQTYHTIESVHFADANTGWVGCDEGVFYTTNGGAVWDIAITPTYATVDSLSFPSAACGWGVNSFSFGGLVTSTDGGHSWVSNEVTEAAVAGTRFYGTSFVTPTQGWACGAGGAIYYTGSAGTSWTAQVSNTAYRLRAIQFVNASDGWAVGDYWTILHTQDGGSTWTAQTSPVHQHFDAVSFKDPLNGWVELPSG